LAPSAKDFEQLCKKLKAIEEREEESASNIQALQEKLSDY
jgi:chaperonin cofactor prefoldin